mmetsp:Transcript_16486/g.34001  ORF Transcript_16486/g.34001 Transcript_16486/m.34001 type:complete len:209 (+) Transcript_16486:626-1252(+)
MSTVGMMSTMHGKVPTKTGKKSQPRIPVVTNVGQSGPPVKMAHFPQVNPGSAMTTLTALIRSLLTPTICLTATMLPNFFPKICCWIVPEINFRMSPRKVQYVTPPTRPMVGSQTARSIRPDMKYMGTPGTGGRRNREMPTTDMAAETAAMDHSEIATRSQARNRYVNLVTSTPITWTTTPTLRDIKITGVHSQDMIIFFCFDAANVSA